MLWTVIWKVWLGTVLSWQHWLIVSTKRLFWKVDSSGMSPVIIGSICVSPSAQGTHCNSPDTSGKSMQGAARSISCHLLWLGLPQRTSPGYVAMSCCSLQGQFLGMHTCCKQQQLYQGLKYRIWKYFIFVLSLPLQLSFFFFVCETLNDLERFPLFACFLWGVFLFLRERRNLLRQWVA